MLRKLTMLASMLALMLAVAAPALAQTAPDATLQTRPNPTVEDTATYHRLLLTNGGMEETQNSRAELYIATDNVKVLKTKIRYENGTIVRDACSVVQEFGETFITCRDIGSISPDERVAVWIKTKYAEPGDYTVQGGHYGGDGTVSSDTDTVRVLPAS
jgi:hypothetical protein